MSLRGLREQNKTRMKVDWNSLWPFRNSKDAKHRLGRVFQRFQSDRFFVVGNKCLFPLRTGRSMNLSFFQILFMYSGVKVSTSSDPLSITVRLHSTTRRIGDALTQTSLDHNDGRSPFSSGSESLTLIALEISVFSMWIWCSCDHCQLTEHVCEIKMTLGQVSLYLDLSSSVSRVHSQEAPCKMLPQHHLCSLHTLFCHARSALLSLHFQDFIFPCSFKRLTTRLPP